jgi:putative transposase
MPARLADLASFPEFTPRDGHPWTRKRVYYALELDLCIKPPKRNRPKVLAVPDAPNVICSIDFMADRHSDGRAFRLPNV